MVNTTLFNAINFILCSLKAIVIHGYEAFICENLIFHFCIVIPTEEADTAARQE